jgi:hypothetical protein
VGCVEGELGCVDFQKVKSAILGTKMMRTMDEIWVWHHGPAYVGFSQRGYSGS